MKSLSSQFSFHKSVEITVEHDGEDCLVLSDESHVIGTITGESSLILGGK